jgi:hypothetical protein
MDNRRIHTFLLHGYPLANAYFIKFYVNQSPVPPSVFSQIWGAFFGLKKFKTLIDIQSTTRKK